MEQLFRPLHLQTRLLKYTDHLLNKSHRLLAQQLDRNDGRSAGRQRIQQIANQLRRQLWAPAHIADQQIELMLPKLHFAGIFSKYG